MSKKLLITFMFVAIILLELPAQSGMAIQRKGLTIADPMQKDSIAALHSGSNGSLANMFNYLRTARLIKPLVEDMPNADLILFFNGIENLNSYLVYDTRINEFLSGSSVEAESMIAIWIDDSQEDIYQFSIQVVKKKSALSSDMDFMSGLLNKLLGVGERGRGEVNYYLNAEYIEDIGPAPSDIKITIKQISQQRLSGERGEDGTAEVFTGDFDNIIAIDQNTIFYYTQTEVKLRNSDITNFGLSIGASYTNVNEKVITPDIAASNLFTVSKDVTSAWKGKAMVLFYVQPDRNSDWQPTAAFWTDEFYYNFFSRFSLNVGMSISERPFDQLFAGVGFSITGAIDLIGGLALINTPTANSTFTFSQVQSFDDIKKTLPGKYEPNFFIGVGVRISQLAKIL